MVSFPTVESRLEHVRVACGYPSQAALMDAIGRRSAQWSTWAKRGNFGQGGDLLLKHVTGVSIDWLKTGDGTPFPHGPIRYAGAPAAAPDLADRLARAEASVDILAAVVGAVIRSIGKIAPAEAAALAGAIGAAVDRADAPAFLPELLAVAKSPALAPAGGATPKQRKR